VLLDDTSERRRRDDEQEVLRDLLGAAASEWRATFDAIEMPIFIIGAGGRIERLNRAARALAGRPFGELLGHRLAEVGEGGLWQEGGRLVEQVRTDRQAASIELRDGGRTWALAASPGTPDLSDKRPTILNVRELTSLVQLQESLRRSQTMAAMGSLVAGVAHEVRNPLFGISAVVDALERRFDHREELAVHLGYLRRELGRLEKLMAELLDFGRPVVPEPEPVLLRQVVDDALAACASQLDRSGVVVDLRSEAGNRPLHLDRRRVCQALVNLVENAIHHAPARSRLEIATETVERGGRCWSQVTVRDHGPGFQDGDLPRLFEPFFSRRHGGTGLGLPIAAKIVEGHDGEIELGNAAGGGAVARVSFPVLGPAAAEDGP
jgi:signal transduction histidine kinase